MQKLITKFNQDFMPSMAVLILVAAIFAVGFLAIPHKTFAQSYDGWGDDMGWVSGDDGWSGDNSGWGDDMGWVYDNGSQGYNDPYSYNDSYYGDPCTYGGCDTYDVYDAYPTYCDSCYSNSYDSYPSYGGGSYNYGCDSSCYSYGASYPSYSTPSYSTPSYNYNSNSNSNSNHSSNTNYNLANSNSSSSANANAVNNNNSPINIVVNVPPGSNNNPPPYTQNLTAYCVASPSNPLIGNQVTWQANASGGNGNYTYSWSGDASGSGQTVYNTYYNAGTRNAYLTVYSNGQQASANCSVNVQLNGSTIGGYYNYQQPLGTPTAGVFLNQIPATGITPGLKMALFALGLFMWSAFGAYMILQKRKMGTLAMVGINASEMEIPTAETTETGVEGETESAPMDLESNLSFRARENNVLISRDGIAAIMARSENDQASADSILNQLISKVSRNEGSYATLNSEKVNSLLNS